MVYDDPAFGAEPMLRASEVTANLRLISLMRGRLEISRLDLTEPSLNLVHAEDGRWNLEALLERTAHIPLAPTAKPKSERAPDSLTFKPPQRGLTSRTVLRKNRTR